MTPNPNLRLALATKPSPPVSLDPTTFMVRVTDNAGRPVSGAEVRLSLAMPTMDMGKNAVTARASPAGTYVGTGRFTMAGTWQVTVTAVKGKDLAAQRFTFGVK